MAPIYGAGKQAPANQKPEAPQAALGQREVTLQGQPQGGSDVPSHENSDPVSDESEVLGSVSLLPENVVYREMWVTVSLQSVTVLELWKAWPASTGQPACHSKILRHRSDPD